MEGRERDRERERGDRGRDREKTLLWSLNATVSKDVIQPTLPVSFGCHTKLG